MEYVYNNPTEAAKGVRKELKAAFPATKFSVRTEYFSMGNSIRVFWAFGPTDSAVCAIVKKYEYGRFDGMTDCSSSEDTVVSMPDGDIKILGGAKFVTTSRNFKAKQDDYKSETAFWERVQRDLCDLQKIEFQGSNTDFYGGVSWNHRDTVSDIAHRVIGRADLTNGYNGLRRVESAEAMHAEERIEVIPMGAPAAVEKVAAQVQEIPADVLAAADDIIKQIGTPIYSMRPEARRAAVAHRCYIRYPALNRDDVLRAVIAILVADILTTVRN